MSNNFNWPRNTNPSNPKEWTRSTRVWRSGDPATLYIECKKCKFRESKPMDWSNL